MKGWVISFLVILVGIGGLSYLRVKKKSTVPVREEAKLRVAVTAEQLRGEQDVNLRDIWEMGQSLKCEFDKGIVYMESGRIRSDQMPSGRHMYSDGKAKYVWRDGDKSGWKYGEIGRTGGYGVGASWALVELDAVGKFKCTDWQIEEGRFRLPLGVKFTDPPRLRGPGM